jgi:hypothetical protein
MQFPHGLFQQLWLHGLRSVVKPGPGSFKDWLLADKFASASVSSRQSFELLVHSEEELFGFIAHDINRFATACFESVGSITSRTIHSRATAWPLIQLYYAAFFGAHAILRVFGYMCTQLDQSHVNAISHAAFLGSRNPAGSLDSGFYSVTYSSSTRTLQANCMRDSHADTWKSFFEFLKWLSSAVSATSSTSAVKADAAKILDSLADALSRNNCQRGNWLSQFRNQVNYHQKHGVWYPYNKKNYTITELWRCVGKWHTEKPSFDLNLRRSEIVLFLEAATLILWMCRRVMLDLNATKSSPQHFVNRGGLTFLRFASWD